MSIQRRNARLGSTVAVYRPTEGDESITWSAVSGLTALKLDLMPVTDEIRRNVFGADANVETMALDHTRTVAKGDGVVVSAGTHSGRRFRVASALQFHRFTQLGLRATTEAIADDAVDATAPASISLTPDTLAMEIDDGTQLTAEVFNADLDLLPDAVIVWSSSDETIATVDANGLVTAVAEGACTISAESGIVSAQCAVTVAEATDLLFAYNAGDDLSDATFSRPDPADYVDQNGDTQTADADVARDDHWIDGTRTLLLEATDALQFTGIEADVDPATEYWHYIDLDTLEDVEGINDAIVSPETVTLATGRAWIGYKLARGVKTLVEMLAL